MKISVCVVKGNNKPKSEDTVVIDGKLISEQSIEYDLDRVNCIAVADGVGGVAGGRDASRFVLKKLSDNIGRLTTQQNLRTLINDINFELLKYGKDIGTPDMATTITGLVFLEDGCYLVHAGNTRLYVMQGEYLKQLTEDQTDYQWLIKTGNFEAAKNCNRNAIRGCLGGGRSSYAEDLVIRKLFETTMPSTLVLTSDGIHEYVDVDALETVLASKDADKDIMDRLVNVATNNGSNDDKSIIIIRNR